MPGTDQIPKTEMTTTNEKCPAWFRARCRYANYQGPAAYADVGAAFIESIARMDPPDLDGDAWVERLEDLLDAIVAGDDEAVLGWLDRELPRCMAYVTGDRRPPFLEGIYRTVIDEEVDITVR